MTINDIAVILTAPAKLILISQLQLIVSLCRTAGMTERAIIRIVEEAVRD